MQTIARADRLEEELEAMRSARALKRIYVMAKDFELEAVVAAGSATICGWAATHLVAWPIRRVRLRPRGRKMREGPLSDLV